MATSAPTPQLGGLAKSLVKERLLSEAEAQSHFEAALRNNVPFVSYLVNNRILSSSAIAETASKEFGLPLFDLSVIAPEVIPAKVISEKLIRRHHVLPIFKRGNRLFLAVSDPTNLQALDEVKFQSRLMPESILVEEDKLAKTIDLVLEAADSALKDLLDSGLDELNVTGGEDLAAVEGELSEADDAPIVRFVNKVLQDAIRKGASDIHFEPYEKHFRIRFRHDGVLHEIASPPVALAGRIAARLKVMARLDIAERRVPQDGRIKLALSRSHSIDFRVNTCPTLFGKNRAAHPGSQRGPDRYRTAWLRAGAAGAVPQGHQQALRHDPGDGPDRQRQDRDALHRPQYPEPAERQHFHGGGSGGDHRAGHQSGERQHQDRPHLRRVPAGLPAAGSGHHHGGEIRDLETAEIAVKAAQTGHLVLSTLHTNDAPQTLNRLVQMGIPPFNIASSVLLIMAQQLAAACARTASGRKSYRRKSCCRPGSVRPNWTV